MSPEIKPRSIKVVLANHTRKILSTISASLYEHFSASDFAIRKNWGSSSSCWSRYFSCLFTSFFRRLLRKTSFHHYIYFVVFSVSSVVISFSSVVILKQFSSGALPPRINCFSSLTRLTSLELTHRRTTFRKHGIWASIPAMMAKQIKTLELQFPMIRFFITSHRQSTRKFMRTSYDCHGFCWLFDWVMPGASEFSANNKAAKHTTYRV